MAVRARKTALTTAFLAYVAIKSDNANGRCADSASRIAEYLACAEDVARDVRDALVRCGALRAERRPGQPVAVWLPYVQEAFLHSDFAVLAAIAPPRIGPGRPRKTEKTPGVGCPTFLIKSPGAQNPTFLEKPRAFAEKTPGVDPKNSGCLTPDCKSPLQLLPARTPGETRFRAKSPSASPNIFEGEVKDGVAHLEYALKGQSFGGRLTNEALASWREQLRQNAQVRSLIQDDAFELAKLARTHEKFWPAPAQLIAAVEARFSQSGEKPSEFAAFTWLTQDKLAAQAAKAEEQMRSLMLLASGGRR